MPPPKKKIPSLIKPITAILTIVLYARGDYNAGDFSADQGFVYITIINNTSVMLALYYLLAFYHATYSNRMLKQGRPLPKFIR